MTNKKRVNFFSRTIKFKLAFIFYFLIFLLIIITLKIFIDTKKTQEIKKTILPQTIKKVINNDKVKFKITEFKQTNGLYEFKLKINNQKYTSYLSHDGKILFPKGININDLSNKKTKKVIPSTNKSPSKMSK